MPTRVLAIFAGESRLPGACEIYRITMPLYVMGQESDDWVVGWTWFSEIAREFDRDGVNAVLNLIANHDLFIFPRLFFQDEKSKELLAFLFSMIRTAGKRIVYEVDDDYSNQHRKVVDGDALTPAAWADAITVTTPMLGRMMQQKTKRPVYMLPNCIDPGLWALGTEPDRGESFGDKIVISLTGSSTHNQDWRVLETVMPLVLAENPNVHFVVMGYHPSYLKGLPNTSYLEGMSYQNYAQVIRGSDIILAPVDPNDGFNNYKSPIKAVEGMAARRVVANRSGGAAVIATDNPVYRLAIKDGKTGLMVSHTAVSWYNAITSLVRNTDLRTELQIKGHAWVYKTHDISAEWKRWAAAYRTILSKPANSLLPHSRFVNQPQ